MCVKTFVNRSPALAIGAVYLSIAAAWIAFELTGSELAWRAAMPGIALTVGAIGTVAVVLTMYRRTHDVKERRDMKRSERLWVLISEVHETTPPAKHFACGRCGETFELIGYDQEPPAGSSEIGVCKSCWLVIYRERTDRLGLDTSI